MFALTTHCGTFHDTRQATHSGVTVPNPKIYLFFLGYSGSIAHWISLVLLKL